MILFCLISFRLGPLVSITHILFVVNVLLFSDGSLMGAKFIHRVLDIYSGATRMEVNQFKSCILFHNIVLDQEGVILSLLPFHVGDFQEGF
jgi:hypothetical protein